MSLRHLYARASICVCVCICVYVCDDSAHFPRLCTPAEIIRGRSLRHGSFRRINDTRAILCTPERTLMHPWPRRRKRAGRLAALDGRQDSSRTCPDTVQLANAGPEHGTQNERMHMRRGARCRENASHSRNR